MFSIFIVVYSLVSTFMLVSHEASLNEQEYIRENIQSSIISLEYIDEVAQRGGRGTGFITTAKSGKRVIVTNAHVCEAGPVFLAARRVNNNARVVAQFPATVIAQDSAHDLCLLEVPRDLSNVPALELASNAMLDERVYIIGYPATNVLSVSSGNLRGNLLIDAPYDETPIDRCIGEKYRIKTVSIKQNGIIVKKEMCFLYAYFTFTDALSDRGASGSPTVNSNGKVVGVLAAVVGDRRAFGILVPLYNLKKFLSNY